MEKKGGKGYTEEGIKRGWIIEFKFAELKQKSQLSIGGDQKTDEKGKVEKDRPGGPIRRKRVGPEEAK